MTDFVTITMTRRGFDVTVAGRTASFSDMQHALDYASDRLHRAVELRDLSARCE